MRFYLDENLSSRIAEIARGLGLDVVSSHELGRNKLSDEEQLRLAALDGRCLVTANRQDLVRITNSFFDAQRPHAGVLIVPGSWNTADFSHIAQALASYARSHASGSTSYLLDVLR